MNNESILLLKKQISKVISIIEEQYKIRPTSMLELILKRYRNALEILENKNKEDISLNDFYIEGGTRAYLDSASDWENPLLEEMDKAEKLVKNTFN
ncbi:hypothetical protein [Halalkalibacterium halodurans]|uniref:hypothetical protein n=1 Tax=Halalkalibacterium halodurans TaxID=86665 RepID=UPI002AAA2904|nr:hypothetical protein [Halalkalibacterium halodurans]MDY7224623.1 hypothetical protein [Halalkalibacterium halodurans]MDY7240746.1 hypothetical protein [Halalkalibacterium halodurans]